MYFIVCLHSHSQLILIIDYAFVVNLYLGQETCVSKMNGNTRRRKYQEIVKRDGEYCRCCGKLPYEGQLVIDHRDNYSSNNSLTNLQLLCRACNYIKNPRKRPDDLCVNYKSNRENESCLSINREKEPLFKEFVYKKIHRGWSIALKAIINSGAEEIDASPVTVKRYLDKMVSSSGKLIVWEHDNISMVTFKEKSN